jgi:hypothetical protein
MHRPLHHPASAHAHAHTHAHRLVRWQRLALHATGTLLLLTGLAWLAVHYSIGAGAGELPHPVEAWSLRLHGLGALAACFVLGVLAAAHVPQGLRLSRRRRWAGQRRSGLGLCVLSGLLVGSGYALYYFAPEAIRPALGWAHAGIGIVMGIAIGRHRRGTRSRQG